MKNLQFQHCITILWRLVVMYSTQQLHSMTYTASNILYACSPDLSLVLEVHSLDYLLHRIIDSVL